MPCLLVRIAFSLAIGKRMALVILSVNLILVVLLDVVILTPPSHMVDLLAGLAIISLVIIDLGMLTAIITAALFVATAMLIVNALLA